MTPGVPVLYEQSCIRKVIFELSKFLLRDVYEETHFSEMSLFDCRSRPIQVIAISSSFEHTVE